MRRSRYIRGKICFKLFQRWRLIAKLFVGCCNAEEHRKSICRLLKHGRHIKKLLLAVATRKTHWKIDTTISRRGWTIKKTLTICHSSPILVIDWIQFSIAYIKCKLNVRNDKKKCLTLLLTGWTPPYCHSAPPSCCTAEQCTQQASWDVLSSYCLCSSSYFSQH